MFGQIEVGIGFKLKFPWYRVWHIRVSTTESYRNSMSQTNDKLPDRQRGGTTSEAYGVPNLVTKCGRTRRYSFRPRSCTSVHLISFRYCRRRCPWVHWHSRSGSRDPSWHCLQQQTEHARRSQNSHLVQTGDVSLIDLRHGFPDLRLRTGCGTLRCPSSDCDTLWCKILT
jgi:hypothetical protein